MYIYMYKGYIKGYKLWKVNELSMKYKMWGLNCRNKN